MATMVFVNFPVSDLKRSTAFYEKLGFTQNKEFSTDEAVSMVWDDHFWIMLLNHEFYSRFIKDKTIADTKTTSSALIAFRRGFLHSRYGNTGRSNVRTWSGRSRWKYFRTQLDGNVSISLKTVRTSLWRFLMLDKTLNS